MSSTRSIAASTARSLAAPHAEDVLSITSGSANNDTRPQPVQRRHYVTDETKSTGTLFVILLAFMLSSITATMVLSNHAYNFTPAPHWVMVGSLTSTSVSLRVRNAKRLIVTLEDPTVYTNGALYDMVLNATALVSDGLLAAAAITDLQPNTKYYYATFSTELSQTILDSGSFITAPDPSSGMDGGATSTMDAGGFKFATAGCAWTGSASNVFTEIANEPDLLFLLHLGDLHYEDLDTTDINTRIEAYDKVMASPSQRQLLNKVALAYMYDDHDFLGNDSGRYTGTAKARMTALQAYRLGIPHYPLAAIAAAASSTNMTLAKAAQQGNYQAFTIGSVRFILTDLRSESTDAAIYSTEQRNWLVNELSQAASYDFVVLVSTKPWVGAPEQGEDNWMGHPQDRRYLSATISQLLATTQNLLMISSDAHMVAFDDGSNTYYGGDDNATGALSFPILMSGPFDRLGSAKGGPFSDGCHTVEYERNHQYSVIEYKPPSDEAGGNACLLITAYSIDYFGSKKVVFTKSLCGQIFKPSNPGVGSCSSSVLTENTQAVLGLALALLFTVVLLETCLLGDKWLHRICLFAMVVVMFVLTVFVGLVIPVTALGIDQFDTFAIAMISLFQIIAVSFYLAYRVCKERCGINRRRK